MHFHFELIIHFMNKENDWSSKKISVIPGTKAKYAGKSKVFCE